MDSYNTPKVESLSIKPRHTNSIVIMSHDGRELLKIDLVNGTVTGALEDTTEAARQFVKHIRNYIKEKP